MAVGKITKRKVEGLVPGQWLWDIVVKGFGARGQADGVFYCLRYRHRGKQRVYSIGRHGSPWTPDQAREKAKQLLGSDPVGERRKNREVDSTARTFAKEVDRYLGRKQADLKPRAWVELQRHLKGHAKPLLTLRLDEIRKATIAEVLNDIQDNRGPVSRNRFRSNLSAFFAWAISEGMLEANPVEGTAKAKENGARERTLTPSELAEVWAALGDDDFSNILRLLILTGQRREEIGGLRWSEVDFDRSLLVLPAARTKNKLGHELPLSPQARAILESLRPKASGNVIAPNAFVKTGRELVFGIGKNGFNGYGYSKARLDKRIAEQRAKPMPAWTLHDLRRTAATGMADMGILPHHIEAVLNHVSGHKAGVAGIYNRAKYETEMREALGKWGNYLEAITAQ